MRPAPWLIAGLLLPIVVMAQPARAPKATAQDPFSELFDTACMQHIGAPARLQSLMDANGLTPLQPAEAATLLQGQPGMAWMVPLASGRYAVSWADDGTCTVYAEKADPAVVQKGFARLMQAAPKPLQIRSLPSRGPLSGDQVAIQYGWATPGESKLRVRFRLVTRQAAEAGVQAMASATPG
ncbi:NMCC_0638 family (lipo)protein, partial [Stenotrophomonas indicatrix]